MRTAPAEEEDAAGVMIDPDTQDDRPNSAPENLRQILGVPGNISNHHCSASGIAADHTRLTSLP
eukprot:5283240-Prymnesium_polylepis.1